MGIKSEDLLNHIHETIFGILCDIDDYCRDHGITYYLCGGTCLGAARHQGFIPWDDDADISIPRKDYERFMVGFKETYGSKYHVYSLQTDDAWPVPRGKVEDKNERMESQNTSVTMAGFAVDVFPMDGLPDQEWRQLLDDFAVRVLFAVRNAAVKKELPNGERYRLAKKLLRAVVLFFKINPRKVAERIDRLNTKYDFDNARYVASKGTVHYGIKKEVLERKDVAPAVYLDFEGRKLPVFHCYKSYLKNMFGPDYMQIPNDKKITGYTHLEGARIISAKGMNQ